VAGNPVLAGVLKARRELARPYILRTLGTEPRQRQATLGEHQAVYAAVLAGGAAAARAAMHAHLAHHRQQLLEVVGLQYGNARNRINWLRFVLPYTEQDNLYRGAKPWFDGTQGSFGFSEPVPRPFANTVMKGFLCPSDPRYDSRPPGVNGGFTGNYLGCDSSTVLGNSWFVTGGATDFRGGTTLNGPLHPACRHTLVGPSDGTSKTLLISESLRMLDFFIVGCDWPAWSGEVLFTTANPPDSPVPDRGYSWPTT
jgi:hypothetical protein